MGLKINLTNPKTYDIIQVSKAQAKNQRRKQNEEHETLKKNLLKACFNKYTPATNRNRIDKFANQMRYLEKMIRPDMKE